jgi:hypothetical protein
MLIRNSEIYLEDYTIQKPSTSQSLQSPSRKCEHLHNLNVVMNVGVDNVLQKTVHCIECSEDRGQQTNVAFKL